jgi:hypothetical protein
MQDICLHQCVHERWPPKKKKKKEKKNPKNPKNPKTNHPTSPKTLVTLFHSVDHIYLTLGIF